MSAATKVQTHTSTYGNVVNGIDTDAVHALIDDVDSDPAKGMTHWRVASTWQGGTHSRAQVDGFAIGGAIGLGPYAGKRDEVFAEWSARIRDLAACPNVHIKLGGLGMRMFGFTHHLGELPPSSEELAAAWRPYIETCIAAFGPERAMFESNFPVDKGSCGYAALWNAFKRIAAGCSAAEKAALFSGTATKFYRLG